ncbi:HD domain-containing protein [Aquisalinus flavus]|uniref:Uncharacterized protein n=1 Tax=Aquisalinus flavus TaxID=1526572 RepID=A0A8J2V7I6_9PROT|nr:HD domain-containing protein [Aquisalinus flavus]MBD0426373.1 bifunctional (p)ppGpp synthetase/guanosine-3',5'-bis(diphosphate) 3'-pyrophosphohydrolase [Aquisalinus flavus]UNE48062.1 bifunctional (p)ppGpp synthetase/guanosine-3',5'-bis(diphosphate) 3'-pyrophosphohydrolase [Aquisalinus flavus]GGD08515.1 hypothetical protein GCM10011342_16640 [Aquisalinus flavus]
MTKATAKKIARAYEFAAANHGSQRDKAGNPYLHHVLDVARRVRSFGPEYEIVAALHDSVEDTEASLEEIEELFGKEICRGVEAMTHRPDEEYFDDYMARVLMNPISQVVKFADSTDNLAKAAQIEDPVKRARMEAKYRKALAMLADVLPAETVEAIRSVF